MDHQPRPIGMRRKYSKAASLLRDRFDFSLVEVACFAFLLWDVHLTTHYKYLLFHSSVELFSIFIAITVFIIAINCRDTIRNQYILVVGISYLFVGFIDTLHTLAFKGMPIFTDYDYYAPQFWIAARYMESLSMLGGFLFIGTNRRVNLPYLVSGYLLVTFGLVSSILYFKIFPICFVHGSGLTSFKVGSEYIICSIFLLNIFVLRWRHQYFDDKVYSLIQLSMIMMIAMELCFTLYVSDTMSDAFNEAGHLFKVTAFYLIYKAVVVTGLREPINLLFRDLKISERRLIEAQQLVHLGRWKWVFATDQWKWTTEVFRFLRISESSKPSLALMCETLEQQDQQTLKNLLQLCRENGTPFEHVVHALLSTGEDLFAQIRGEVSRDETGAVDRLVGTLLDVTDEQLLMNSLRAAKEMADSANVAKSVFLANMSHEFRTPLNAILGFSTLMRKDPLLPESLQQNMDIINRSGQHLLTLINDVLDLAKIESGRIHIENTAFDLGNMVRDVTEMMQVRAREKGVQLLIDQSSEFPRYIVGDEIHLRQILINLLGNAIKFTQQGGVSLRLATRENKISHLIIEVEDSGSGIAPEDQDRIFEAFTQLGDQGTNKGTGLGLTITRQFVEMMGGHITLESSLGSGSLFRVDLPLGLATGAEVSNQTAPQIGDVVSLAPGQPDYKVLIVEDQLENQLLLSKLMESVGFLVKVAGDGEQGVKLFKSWHPHFIWMDRRMPIMDGVEATKIIRTLPGGKDVKIVAVTASAFKEQQAEVQSAGMDDFVRKPYRFNEIYDCIARLLGVQFVYKNSVEEEKSLEALTSEMLAKLPEVLRQDLKSALESLDANRIEAIVVQIAPYDQNLQKTIARMIGNYDYPGILKVLGAMQS